MLFEGRAVNTTWPERTARGAYKPVTFVKSAAPAAAVSAPVQPPCSRAHQETIKTSGARHIYRERRVGKCVEGHLEQFLPDPAVLAVQEELAGVRHG